MTGGKAPRRKGIGFELEVVHAAQEAGLIAKRIPMSGSCEGYKGDVIIGDHPYECKRGRAPLSPKLEKFWQKAHEQGCKGVITRCDRGVPMIYIPLSLYLKLIKDADYA